MNQVGNPLTDRVGSALTAGHHLLLSRCPYCGIASPLLSRIFGPSQTTGTGGNRLWSCYACSVCGGVTTSVHEAGSAIVTKYYPSQEELDATIPEKPREYLRQARESLAQPIGSIVCAAGAVDAMLKANNLIEGSLYARIDQASAQHLITDGMAQWAHQVRLEANDQRHADESAPLPTVSDAERCYEFAVALAEFLFVLPTRVTRGLRQSQS